MRAEIVNCRTTDDIRLARLSVWTRLQTYRAAA